MSKKSKLGWLLLSGASLAAMGAVSNAAAQETSDEIVVTATGRAAAIQDVPIAVTALNTETLQDAGVNNLIDLRQVTPNLRIGSGQSQSSGTSAAIRGLGTGSDNPGFEAAVGIFVDGVYRARAGTAISDLGDVERIEILRGPQGTLYGKNTTAGAISVVTQGPDFEPGMWIEGSAGDLGLLSTRFGGNLPLSDSFAMRLDATIRGRDGYIDVSNLPGEEFNNTDRWNGRFQILWDLSPDASLRFIADASETNEACCAAVTFADTSLLAPFPFSPAMNITQPGSIGVPNPEARTTSITQARMYDDQTEDFGLSAQLDWNIGGVNFTSITAHRDWESLRDQDIDFSAMDRSYRDGLAIGVESFTQEFRLQGEWGRVNWLLGAFYGDEQITQTDTIRYGTQAGDYIDRLFGFFDFSGAPFFADDANGPLPGSGLDVFSCAAGAPGPGGSSCILDYVLPAFASVSAAAEATVPGTTAALMGGIGTFAGTLNAFGLPGGAGQQADNWGIDTTSLAIFTHNEISLTDNLILTLGARWTQEEKDMGADINAAQPACAAIRANLDATYAALLVGALGPYGDPQIDLLASGFGGAMLLACNPAVNDVQDGIYSRSLDDDAVSGTASLAYHASPDLMLYAGYSRGYKSGGFNIDRSGMNVFPWTPAPGQVLSPYVQQVIATFAALGRDFTNFGAADLQFDPETIDSYEAGFKWTLFGGTSTLNMAIFHQQLHDYQLNAFNGFNFITRNVPEVVSEGVEMEFLTRPSDQFTFTFGALYNDVFYDSTVQFGSNPSDIVRSGDPLTLSPEWTLTASMLYEQPLSDNLMARFYINGRYLSDYRLQTLSRNPLTDQDAFSIFDARLGIGNMSDSWSLDFWVRNLTDEYYSIGAFSVPEQSLFSSTTGQVEGVFAAYPNEPRTWGVTLRARY